MVEIQKEHQVPATSLDDSVLVLAFWTLIWGPLIAVEFLQADKALLFVTPITLIAAFRNRKLAFNKYRPLIVILAAFFAGYFWHAYLEQNSEDFKARASALEACTKFKPCVDRVQLGGFDIGPVGR
ncbi:MAG TPA: hypothetical protein VIJ67_07815 [Pseudolabrys sp.]